MSDDPKETPSEVHDRLGREFVMRVGREAASAAEMMVVVESVMLATMLMLVRIHAMQPWAATVMVDEAVQRAQERLGLLEIQAKSGGER